MIFLSLKGNISNNNLLLEITYNCTYKSHVLFQTFEFLYFPLHTYNLFFQKDSCWIQIKPAAVLVVTVDSFRGTAILIMADVLISFTKSILSLDVY